jgi:hypothetical protein
VLPHRLSSHSWRYGVMPVHPRAVFRKPHALAKARRFCRDSAECGFFLPKRIPITTRAQPDVLCEIRLWAFAPAVALHMTMNNARKPGRADDDDTVRSRAEVSHIKAAPIPFEKLVYEHLAFVWRTLRRFGVRPLDVDDAT